MSHYLDKIKRFPIWEKAFTYLIQNNTASHPYHNTRHCINVFNTAINIIDTYEDIDINDVVNLGLACLFHDFNHSGGKLKDRENIEIAIDEFNRFVELNVQYFNVYAITDIVGMILCTEFPKTKEPSIFIQQIIMDADLFQCYDHDWFIFAIKGLADERGVPESQALKDQTNFINSVTYYTEFAQKIHEEKKEGYLEQLEYLKTVFK